MGSLDGNGGHFAEIRGGSNGLPVLMSKFYLKQMVTKQPPCKNHDEWPPAASDVIQGATKVRASWARDEAGRLGLGRSYLRAMLSNDKGKLNFRERKGYAGSRQHRYRNMRSSPPATSLRLKEDSAGTPSLMPKPTIGGRAECVKHEK